MGWNLTARALVLAVSLSLCAVAGVTPAGAHDAASAAVSKGGYKLGPGDRLRVVVFDEDALTGEFAVSSAGVVSLPLIGDVSAAGLTIGEFQEAVKADLRHGYLTDPRVSVEVLNYRPFYILGEVNKPGEYSYSDGLTTAKAVAVAGGFTYRANMRRVYVRHAGEQAESAQPLSDTTTIQPGDTLRVPQRFF